MPTINIVNGGDASFTSNRFVLWFGNVGSTYLMVWADHLDEAFDEAMDWIAENEPGYLCDEQVTESFLEAKAEGRSDDDAFEDSLIDVSTGGNSGNHVNSWEWGIALDNPSREQILELQGRPW